MSSINTNQSSGQDGGQEWKRVFTSSSRALLGKLDLYSGGANLVQLMKELYQIHPEYGLVGASGIAGDKATGRPIFKDLIEFLQGKSLEDNLPLFSSAEWAEEVLSVIQPPSNKDGLLQGRMFLIAALLSQFTEVNKLTNADSSWQSTCIQFIKTLGSELESKENIFYKSLLTPKGNELESELMDSLKQETKSFEDHVMGMGNTSDGPAKEDSLSRVALAQYLSKRLRYIYNRDVDKGGYGSFFMHIDGAWGSGKSTLLGFLENELEKQAAPDPKIDPGQSSESNWIVVNFNAWENQRLDPPWWFLMSGVFREAMKKLKEASQDKSNPFRQYARNKRRMLLLNEYFWRFNTGTNYLLAAGATLILFIIAAVYNVQSEEAWNKLSVVQLVSFIGFLWSITKFIRTSLAAGSASAAQAFIRENGKDPMKVLSSHFEDQIKRIGHPVAIFIDDLDRCNADYGIKLLEGLQTIFKKAPVIYVIAADRKWLSTMYEKQYDMFADVIAKPAKPFGMVFLDKIFQFIVELPDISSIQKKIYWDSLLNIQDTGNGEMKETELNELKTMVSNATTNSEKLNIPNLTTGNEKIQQVAREQAVGAVSIGEEEKHFERKLQKFVDILEPNPRAMKRLINDVSTAKAMTYLYNQAVQTDQLILWTILKLQHPLLADYFWEHADKLSEIESFNGADQAITGESEFDRLLLKSSTRNLFRFSEGQHEIVLDKEFINNMRFVKADPVQVKTKLL